MKIYRHRFLRLCSAVILTVGCTSLLESCKQDTAGTDPGTNQPDTPIATSIPKSPDAIVEPADNPSSPAKVELGRHLFYDRVLSVDGSTSCGSCHNIGAGLADKRGLATSMGFDHEMGTRNAPALGNIAFNTSFTWDGKFTTLEAHAQGPIFNSLEMGNNFTNNPAALDSIATGYNSKPGGNDTLFLFKRLDTRPGDLQGVNYKQLKQQAWQGAPWSMDLIAKSIAAFERTFISTQSTFDKYNNGDASVLRYNPNAIRGLQLFTDVNGANCVSCHSGYNFTDQKFHDNGIGVNTKADLTNVDKGRSTFTKNSADDYQFKTPSLRNVALTAPYMHNGRFATLADVLANYRNGGKGTTTYQDPRITKIKSLNLSDQDISDIIEFLKTLTDNSFVMDKPGKLSNPWGD